MNLIATVMDAVERAPLLDGLTLAGSEGLCGHYRLAPVPR
jgi:hypothetical protein